MNIQHKSTETKGSFYVSENEDTLAEMTYSKAGQHLIIIDHTEVSDQLKGKGAGRKMVEVAVLHARNNQLKILPLCPFAKSVFDKTPEFRDVLS
ncbi:MAG: GNAT family N-acetyltransferase [Cyclobacteriaceae bacterium]